MTQRHRQAGNALLSSEPIIRTVAVHEAGHCVGRVLTAKSLGWPADEVIEYIEVGSAPIATGLFNNNVQQGLRSQVASWGRFLSRPMQDFVPTRRPYSTLKGVGPIGENVNLVGLFAEMRGAGIDLDAWFRARSIVAMFGPMAEARLTQTPLNEIWNNSGAAKEDERAIIRAGTLCGMSPKRVAAASAENANFVDQQVARPEVWDAIITLADSLKPGRMSGAEAAAIIMRSLGASPDLAPAGELPSKTD